MIQIIFGLLFLGGIIFLVVKFGSQLAGGISGSSATGIGAGVFTTGTGQSVTNNLFTPNIAPTKEPEKFVFQPDPLDSYNNPYFVKFLRGQTRPKDSNSRIQDYRINYETSRITVTYKDKKTKEIEFRDVLQLGNGMAAFILGL